MQHATERVERPGESQEALDGKKSPTEWPLLIQGLQPRLHVVHLCQAPCCLELFGCCCRRLSQHGVGEVLILLRHCWPDAFFCVRVGSGLFCPSPL